MNGEVYGPARIILIALVLSMLMVSVCPMASVAAHGSAADIVVRVGAYENPPKVFTDDSAEVRGFFPEVLEYIAGEEGWTLEYVVGNWTDCLQRLSEGTIDVMVDVAFSEDRVDDYLFTNESMLISWGVVYSQPGMELESIPELDGMRVAVMKESIHTTGDDGIMSIVEKFQLDVAFVEYEDYIGVFEAIDSGSVDAGVVNRIYGGMYEDDYDVVRTPIIFNPADLRFAFPLNATMSPYLAETIDLHIIELKMDQDSVYYMSLKAYMPSLFEEVTEVHPLLVPALLVSFGFLGVIVSLNLLLRRQVKARTAELRTAYSDLVREKGKSDFYLDLMSHDMANISQGIHAYAELADEEATDGCIMAEYTSGILGLTRRSFGLIGNVRMLSRLGEEKNELVPIDIAPLVSECVAEVVRASSEDDVRFVHVPPGEEVAVAAEPRIKNLFAVIISNAVRHQPGKRKVVEVDFSIDRADGTVSVSVADHGPGIPDERKPTMFRRHEGTGDQRFSGIGLLLAHELAKRYGGTIEVLDRVEGDHTKGARFVVTLPLAGGPAAGTGARRRRTRRLSTGG